MKLGQSGTGIHPRFNLTFEHEAIIFGLWLRTKNLEMVGKTQRMDQFCACAKQPKRNTIIGACLALLPQPIARTACKRKPEATICHSALKTMSDAFLQEPYETVIK